MTAGAQFSICRSAVGQTKHCRSAHCDVRVRIQTARTQSSIAGAPWLQRLHCRSGLLECVVALP
ncbi:hypothetical protein AMTR_s04340p00000570, partial [Amborella trichopoda]